MIGLRFQQRDSGEKFYEAWMVGKENVALFHLKSHPVLCLIEVGVRHGAPVLCACSDGALDINLW